MPLIALFGAVILAACGSSGGDVTNEATTTTEATVREHDAESDEEGEDAEDEDEDVTTTTTSTTTTEGRVDPAPPEDPDGELTAFERDYIAELSPEMSKGLGLPSTLDVECLATAWVRSIGGDRLQSAGFDPETFLREGPADLHLDRETARTMHRRGLDCGFTAEVFMNGLVPHLADCPDARISDDDFEEVMIAAFTDVVDDELEQRLELIGEACAER